MIIGAPSCDFVTARRPTLTAVRTRLHHSCRCSHTRKTCSHLTYVDTRDDVSNIWSVRLENAKQSELTNFNSKRIFHYALSRDGKSFVMTRGPEVSDVVLIRDFR